MGACGLKSPLSPLLLNRGHGKLRQEPSSWPFMTRFRESIISFSYRSVLHGYPLLTMGKICISIISLPLTTPPVALLVDFSLAWYHIKCRLCHFWCSMPPKESARNFEDRVAKRRRTNAGATPRPSGVQSTEQWNSSYYRRSGPADPWADLRYHYRSDASPTNSSFNSVGCVHIIYCPQVQFVPDPVEPSRRNTQVLKTCWRS